MDDRAKDNLSNHLPRMYRVALRVVGCPEAAGEAVQNACVKALGNLEQFDGRSLLVTWLHRITVNCAIDILRENKRQGLHRTEVGEDIRGLMLYLGAGPAETVQQREQYAIAQAMLEELPDECRSAFMLTQLDGYSYDEAAIIEGQPRGTIASRVYRARKILLQRLAVQVDGRS